MTKKRLNITVDPEVLDRARRYSRRHGTSISHLVGEFLSALPRKGSDSESDLPPTVRRLRGIARRGPDRNDYRQHLADKHGV